MINEDNQWTVVVISADKQNDTLTAEDLYYINQGTSGDTFWTDGMGTKTELEAGDYILRIGGETITSAEDLIEIPFTLAEKSTGREVQLGECDGITAAIDSGDAITILKHFAGSVTLTGDALIAAECDGITASIDSGDAMAVLDHFAGKKVLGTVVVND
jgi:hypothetical protein